MRGVIFLCMMLLGLAVSGQSITIRGEVIDLRSEERLKHATVLNLQSKQSVLTDHQGEFVLAAAESDSITISAVGYLTDTVVISSSNKFISVQLKPLTKSLEEVVISGTMREIRKSTSPIAVESYSAKFFKKM
jgi:outer membrane receptor for ferrienterochelin and colicins